MTNNKGKIVEVIGVENKTVYRPNDNGDSVVVVEKGRETDQFNKNEDDQVAYSKDDIMDMLRTICREVNELKNGTKGQLDEIDKKWGKLLRKPETDQLKENTEVELKQVSGGSNISNYNDTVENGVSESDDNKVNYNSENEREMGCKGVETDVDQTESCLLYTSRCV